SRALTSPDTSSRLRRRRLSRLRENERDQRAATDLALNAGSAPVKIDNRLYQSEPQSRSIRPARRFCAVKPIEHPRQMFASYSRAIITDCDLEIGRMIGKRNLDGTVLRSKTQRVIDQIAHSALKQCGVGRNLSLARAVDRHVSIFCDRFIKRRNFL